MVKLSHHVCWGAARHPEGFPAHTHAHTQIHKDKDVSSCVSWCLTLHTHWRCIRVSLSLVSVSLSVSHSRTGGSRDALTALLPQLFFLFIAAPCRCSVPHTNRCLSVSVCRPAGLRRPSHVQRTPLRHEKHRAPPTHPDSAPFFFSWWKKRTNKISVRLPVSVLRWTLSLTHTHVLRCTVPVCDRDFVLVVVNVTDCAAWASRAVQLSSRCLTTHETRYRRSTRDFRWRFSK